MSREHPVHLLTLPRQAWFTRLARWIAHLTGRPASFLSALLVIFVWAVTGPIFRFSDTWQLVINTSTTIVTFLMVFLIQNTQNRDSLSLHLKLDELIRAKKGARNSLLDLDDLSDEELDKLRLRFAELAARAKKNGGAEVTKTEVTVTKESESTGESKIAVEETTTKMTIPKSKRTNQPN
jgi:low affinity Fe/Cu permease